MLKVASEAKQAELKFLLQLTSDTAINKSVDNICSTTFCQVAEDSGIKLTDARLFAAGSPEPLPIASKIKFFTQHYGTIVRWTTVLAHMSFDLEMLRKSPSARITDKA